jgi:hypothetical protein
MATRASGTPRQAQIEIPRPGVTEFAATTVVPVFPHGEAGPVAGSPGEYDVVLVLGVPGLNGVLTDVNFDEVLRSGDSLLEGTGLQIELQTPAGITFSTATIVSNSHGRLAQVRMTVTAADFASAEEQAYDTVTPTLSRIAFEANTPA